MRNISLKDFCMFLLIFVAMVGCIFYTPSAYAAQFLSRSVAVGNSLPSANTTHTYSFNIPTVGTIGSIEFEYCTNSPLVGSPCTAPVGLDVSGVVLASQTGVTGFAVDAATTSNKILISRVPGVNAAVPVTYRFSNALNHSTPNSPVFVRISSYATNDGSGPRTDEGAVAFSTSANFTVSGYVPPYLTFCVGVTVAGDCTSASGQLLSLGELRTNQTSFVTSQFAGATNDPGGYSTFLTGLTMTSGTNTIPALATPTSSQQGFSQFGVNLRANSNPGVGSNPSGVGTAVPTSDFNQTNLYTFKNEQMTNSTLSTDFNLFTVSYIVNVSSSQPAGVYNTTLTYIATAAF